MIRIKGKTALVTGASSGLGKAIAIKLAKSGANLILVARREELLNKVADEITEIGRKVFVVACDISNEAEVSKALELISSQFSKPDILINAAGIAIWKPFFEVTDAEHRAMMETNYWGTHYWIRRLLPHMLEQGSGHIVNISSGSGKIGMAVTSGYSAASFAISGFSESLYRELKGSGVGVSCIHPGSIKTEIWNEQNIPKQSLPPLVRYSPKLSASAVARQVIYCIRLGIPVRTLPFFVGFLTRVNAIWIRLGDLLMWKWFFPVLIVWIAGRVIWRHLL